VVTLRVAGALPWCVVLPPDPDYPSYRSRAPWWGGDLQTLRNSLRGSSAAEAALARVPQERLWLDLADGTGDQLAALLQRPESASGALPLAVLVHGLGGDETGVYMQVSAAHLLALGHAVVRLDLRGAGPSRDRCRFHYHAGRSEDLRAALRALVADRPELVRHGIALIGYSLGGNMVLKFAGEGEDELPVRAVVSVSAPVDLAAASRRFLAPRNRFYHWHMLRRLKSEAIAPGAETTASEREAILGAKTLYEFDDRFVAPRAGFRGADEYYERSSARRFVPGIRVPTLALHALDDPWIPSDAYREIEWQGPVRALLAGSGGHVGFHARGRVCWHDGCIEVLFETLFS